MPRENDMPDVLARLDRIGRAPPARQPRLSARFWCLVGLASVAGVALLVALGWAIVVGAKGMRAEQAEQFRAHCTAAAFTPEQCAFLAKLARRAEDQADDAATLGAAIGAAGAARR